MVTASRGRRGKWRKSKAAEQEKEGEKRSSKGREEGEMVEEGEEGRKEAER